MARALDRGKLLAAFDEIGRAATEERPLRRARSHLPLAERARPE
jgi:hypothetical protein